jgi:uncharacterized protein YggT (Ycf19 family)
MARRHIVRDREMVREDREDNEFYEMMPMAQPVVAPRVVGEQQYSAARVVAWITTAVVLLLALRILLRLVGASSDSLLISAIYGLTQPLVAPFTGAITLPLELGVAAFEWATVIAMVVYAVIGYLIAGFIRAARPSDIDEY